MTTQFLRILVFPHPNDQSDKTWVALSEWRIYGTAPLVVPAFGGPSLLSAMAPVHLSLDGGVTSATVYAAAHFNATKTPASAFRYYATTNNHTLISIENLNETSGAFDLATNGDFTGDATVTVRAIAVERDVSVWKAESIFAVSVGNADPTLSTLALADVSGDQVFNLTQYFTDIDDDDATLIYAVSVEDARVVNATVVGNMMYLQNGIFREGRSLVTVTASDGYGNASSSFNSTYSFVFSYSDPNFVEPVARLVATAGAWFESYDYWYLETTPEGRFLYGLVSTGTVNILSNAEVEYDPSDGKFYDVGPADPSQWGHDDTGTNLAAFPSSSNMQTLYWFGIDSYLEFQVDNPYYEAPVVPAFGGPSLLSLLPAVHLSLDGGATSETIYAAAHFNATKTPASAFKYYVSTNNHVLISIENFNETSGTFDISTNGNFTGDATVTVRAVAVERDVDAWKAETTFTVSVTADNADPTLSTLALADVSGDKVFNLTKYFTDADDHDATLIYAVSVEDPLVVNATLTGNMLYLQNGVFREGRSLVTVTASDGYGNASASFNSTYSFSSVALSYEGTHTYEFLTDNNRDTDGINMDFQIYEVEFYQGDTKIYYGYEDVAFTMSVNEPTSINNGKLYGESGVAGWYPVSPTRTDYDKGASLFTITLSTDVTKVVVVYGVSFDIIIIKDDVPQILEMVTLQDSTTNNKVQATYTLGGVSAFGGPSLLSAMPAFTFSGGDAAPRGFAAANYFNATKTPASAFKYFVSTNNNALVSIEFLNETSGEFNLASKGVVGAGTVTVQAVAVERDVDAWRAATTFAVKVVNDLADPTLIQALPDVTNAGAVNLTRYFADTDGDLTYEVEVSDPAVVTASVVGDILTLANAANASASVLAWYEAPSSYSTIPIDDGHWSDYGAGFKFNAKTGDVLCWDLINVGSGDTAHSCGLTFDTISLSWDYIIARYVLVAADNHWTISIDGNVYAVATVPSMGIPTAAVTVRARDSNAQANDTFTVTFSYAQAHGYRYLAFYGEAVADSWLFELELALTDGSSIDGTNPIASDKITLVATPYASYGNVDKIFDGSNSGEAGALACQDMAGIMIYMDAGIGVEVQSGRYFTYDTRNNGNFQIKNGQLYGTNQDPTTFDASNVSEWNYVCGLTLDYV